MFDHILKQREERRNYDMQWSVFDELRGILKCGKPSRAFDIFSRAKLNGVTKEKTKGGI